MQLAMPATGLEGRHALQGAEARAHAELCQHEHQDAALPLQHAATLGHEAAAAQLLQTSKEQRAARSAAGRSAS